MKVVRNALIDQWLPIWVIQHKLYIDKVSMWYRLLLCILFFKVCYCVDDVIVVFLGLSKYSIMFPGMRLFKRGG